MKPQTTLNLQEKGWSTAEIKQAEAILERAERYDVHFSRIVFWSALVVVVFGNVLLSFILIPFLIVLNEWVLFGAIILLAGMMGFLYNFLITDIGHLEKKHQVWAGILVPIIALANVTVTVWASNRFIADLQVNNPPHNLGIASVVFAVAFLMPYVADRIRMKIGERKVIGA